MRLLNTTSHRLESFSHDAIPLYAIFSHRWASHEITFQDLERDDSSCWDRDDYTKLRKICSVAAAHGLGYVWLDTCCIDKTSSSELSQAINSMFRWYREAVVCYAYLADVSEKALGDSDSEKGFCGSEWFERGWTLQELVAPPLVMFLNSSWEEIGTKSSLHRLISKATGIPAEVLLTGDLSEVSVAQKMSWAARRKTTVVEDRAYSLMGLFGVSMPMIYGEGGRAFLRLQEEILRVADDLSLFAWKIQDVHGTSGLLAPDPSAFGYSGSVRRSKPSDIPAVVINNKGIHLKIPVIKVKGKRNLLALVHTEDGGRDIGIWLRPLSKAGDYFERNTTESFTYPDRRMYMSDGAAIEERQICVRHSHPVDEHQVCLWRVAACGHAATMRLLLAQGVAVDTVDCAGRTILSWAAEHGNVEVAGLLLSQGAMLELKDRRGVTPLLRAAMSGKVDLVRMLLGVGANRGWKDLQKRSALSHAAVNGRLGVANLLLDEGDDVEWRDIGGQTPLALAAKHGCREMIELLLNRGAELEAKDDFGMTPLSHAANWGGIEAARLLIQAGADLGPKDEIGRTPLGWALARENTEMVRLLLENGAEEEELPKHRSLTGFSEVLHKGKEHLQLALRKAPTI
ncbi:ankyrin repeat-containing domain protein [Schizothecium vesticola]|uniref:Ankyrin repeat-containing domain protein n=1 Tax=Schizothecium vesticola TaxID=314040 RepID=A0AA40EPE2_9PEZI|nr:ankyrin repeat-containing domain protein [Schizothecium vesticola]